LEEKAIFQGSLNLMIPLRSNHTEDKTYSINLGFLLKLVVFFPYTLAVISDLCDSER